MKRAESFLDLETIEFSFTWWYIQLVRIKWKSKPPSPTTSRMKPHENQNTPFFRPWFWGRWGGVGGLDFPSVLSNNVASGKPLSRKALLLLTRLKSSLQFPLPRRSFFFLYTGRIRSFIIKAPVESNKLNSKYERFRWWNYTRRNF